MNTLYKADFHLWTQRQAALLRAKDFDRLDRDQLVEQILDLAEQERNNLNRRMEKLMRYLLKCKVQPECVSGKWLSTIYQQRCRISDCLEEMPSIRPLFEEYLEEAYAKAAHRASVQAKLPRTFFPATLPFTKQQLMDEKFIP